MTTFEQDETGLDSSNPVELYRFYGATKAYTYTSGNVQVDFDAPSASTSETYEPIPINRGEIVLGDITEKNQINITMPKNIELVGDYVFDIAPNNDLVLEVYRRHQSTGNFRKIFSGVIASFAVQETKVTAVSPSIFTNYLQTEFPNVYFQGNCNHTLYDGGCGLDRALFQVPITISSISLDRLTIGFTSGTLPSGNGSDTADEGNQVFNSITYNGSDVVEWNTYLNDYPDIVFDAVRQVALGNFKSRTDYAAYFYAAFGMTRGDIVHPSAGVSVPTIMSDGWLNAGEIVIGTERRLILSHIGDQITINYPFRSLAIGDTGDVFAGCLHTSQDCRTKFNNGTNFLGFENIPYINPFIIGVGVK